VAEGVQVLGLLGARIPPERLRAGPQTEETTKLLAAVTQAHQEGFRGAVTPHPAGVAVCNQGFQEPEASAPEEARREAWANAGAETPAASATQALEREEG
jgi:hypothetical protein